MRAVGIVCEYNPFHEGHRHQLQRALLDSGCDLTVTVMSEYLTQRGAFSLADPYLRAQAAVMGGADLVVGLPYPYSGASGEYFARGGVEILARLGVSALHFGSECGDVGILLQAAKRLRTPDFAVALTAWQAEHPDCGVMEGRQACYRRLYGEDIPGGSNDLLGIAYLTARDVLCPDVEVYTTPRVGQAYRDGSESARFASALSLRTLLQKEGKQAFLAALPPETRSAWESGNARYPVGETAVGATLLAFYRTADPVALARLQDLSGGVAQRLCESARRAADTETLLSLAAAKRYTAARLRRALWFGYFGVTPEALRAPVSYVRLLAASRKGCAYLKERRKAPDIPLVTKPSDLPADPAAQKQSALQNRLEALYTLALPRPSDAGFFLREKPFIR